ncbi:hypothetical protein N0V88_000949 [Collariella sp. IMI 366227]|nr:hypothetical protein N0V88_000949 [Collariella sp. IMI 366227]
MDQIASVLLNFPPAGGVSDEEYYKAAKIHSQEVQKLAVSPKFKDFAPQLLDHVNPSVNSISYLGLLIAAHNANTVPLPDLLTKITTFLTTFDSRQIRCAGKLFSIVLDWLTILTSHHVSLVKFAYATDKVGHALPLLEKDIVFYPGVKGLNETQPPQLTSTDALQYDFLRGLCFIQRREWGRALDALERVITYPTRDSHACSKIMVEAHNKWILVGLLHTGKTPTVPIITSIGAQKAFATLGKPYHALGKAFEETTAAKLKAEFETTGPQLFSEENNFNLVRLVLQHYQRWQILNLRGVYTKISLEQLRAQTQSAETAAPLASEADVEKLLLQMIDERMLAGRIERPADGGAAYLVFAPADDEISEAQFAREMAVRQQRLVDLAPVVRAMNDRLGSSKDYIKILVNQSKREGNGRRDYEAQFLDQTEDEDLMSEVMSGL